MYQCRKIDKMLKVRELMIQEASDVRRKIVQSTDSSIPRKSNVDRRSTIVEIINSSRIRSGKSVDGELLESLIYKLQNLYKK